MLVELSVVEQRYHAVMEALSAGVPIVEVAERYGVSRKTALAFVQVAEGEKYSGRCSVRTMCGAKSHTVERRSPRIFIVGKIRTPDDLCNAPCARA
jgi:hypothetical protein